ncbi:MAG: ABC transporter permease subunit [Bacilli bacterium]|nr:ABC transporter permease subunit [Bacilli bacterium]
MRRFVTSNPFLYTLGLAFVFLLWLILSYAVGGGELVVPSPAATFSRLFQMLGDPYTYRCLGMTLLRTLEGFAISFVAAGILGCLSGEFPLLRSFLKPMLAVAKSAPTAAFVFLFLLLSGASRAPIWIVVLLAFPILYESFAEGIGATEKEVLDAAAVDGANRIQRLWHLRLPLGVPYVILGLLSSFALSFKTTIMAEIVAGDTGPGLGSSIVAYRSLDPTDLAPIFAIALIAIVVVLLLDLTAYIGNKVLGLSRKDQ